VWRENNIDRKKVVMFGILGERGNKETNMVP